VVYDKFPKAGQDLTPKEIIALSCAFSGLPRPKRVELSAVSAVAGGPPAVIGGNSWGTDAWRLPQRRDGTIHPFGARLMTHVAIEFDDAISGPVLIGAGRFIGLGLCLPSP
jgi:CRISPR-associated protein Csb2